MSKRWEKAYLELKAYTDKNPKIEINKNVTAIPRDVRPEFYRLFDAVRVAFLEEKHGALLDEAALLGKNYTKAEQEAMTPLGLTDIKVPVSLDLLVKNPVNGLMRPLFDPLFNLLKGKTDADAFEQEASIDVEKFFNMLFRSGYEKWVVLSLLGQLSPDEALTIPIEAVPADCETEIDLAPGLREDSVPGPKEVKRLSLNHDWEAILLVPDLIVHSTKLNRYVSVRTDLAYARWSAREVSDKREWHRFRRVMGQHTPVTHWPDLVIYTDDNPEDLALVADFGRFCRPDIIVECMEQSGWYQQGDLESVVHNHDFLKPRLGSYIVSRVTAPEEAPPNIHILTVGYDQSLLAPIIDALPQNGKVDEHESQ